MRRAQAETRTKARSSAKKRPLPCAILLSVLEGAKLGEEDVVRWGVFRVKLEDGTLEVLDGVRLAVEVGDFGEFVGDGVALLGETAVVLPVLAELAAEPVIGFLE